MSLKKSFRGKFNQKRKAFTLMEILVASAIFALVMVITTGAVSQASQYNNKLGRMREVSEESRKLADVITRDIRTANSMIKIDNKFNYAYNSDTLCADAPSVAGATTFKNGLTNLAWRTGNHCLGYETPDLQNPNDDETDLWNNQVLVISSEDKYLLYGSGTVSGTVGLFYKSIPNSSSGNPVTLGQADFDQLFVSANLISDPGHDVIVWFGGYMPYDTNVTGQPIVRFNIVDETKGYAESPVSDRAHTEIRSAVTSRSYN